MTELILYMNNYSITEPIKVYQTYPKVLLFGENVLSGYGIKPMFYASQ